jgi:RHS repeat-associated protein
MSAWNRTEKRRSASRGQEPDEETGFYYCGARYLNPETSVWISADSAMEDYVPRAPADGEAKKHNERLPGMGGAYNYVNFHVYHCAGNNPVKSTDPGGRRLRIAGSAEFRNQIMIEIQKSECTYR